MRHLFAICIFMLSLSCGKDADTDLKTGPYCGCESPQTELAWLRDLINTAETDSTGNYIGTIWFMNYNEQDMFVTDMMLGSGGLLYHFFDCDGNKIVWNNPIPKKEETTSFNEAFKKAKVIYDNIPYCSTNPL